MSIWLLELIVLRKVESLLSWGEQESPLRRYMGSHCLPWLLNIALNEAILVAYATKVCCVMKGDSFNLRISPVFHY